MLIVKFHLSLISEYVFEKYKKSFITIACFSRNFRFMMWLKLILILFVSVLCEEIYSAG